MEIEVNSIKLVQTGVLPPPGISHWPHVVHSTHTRQKSTHTHAHEHHHHHTRMLWKIHRTARALQHGDVWPVEVGVDATVHACGFQSLRRSLQNEQTQGRLAHSPSFVQLQRGRALDSKDTLAVKSEFGVRVGSCAGKLHTCIQVRMDIYPSVSRFYLSFRSNSPPTPSA